jgi:cytochrome b561
MNSAPAIAAPAAYTGTAKALHWLIVALLIGQYVVGYLMPHIGRNTVPETLINLHFSIGIVIIAVAVVRLAWRLTHPEPAPADGVPPWQTATARVVHWLLYLLLFIIPVIGWINASWRGFTVSLFGLEMPKLIATRAAGWQWTGDTHVILAWYVMLAVIGLHVSAALYHRFVRRDGVLARMLPGV